MQLHQSLPSSRRQLPDREPLQNRGRVPCGFTGCVVRRWGEYRAYLPGALSDAGVSAARIYRVFIKRNGKIPGFMIGFSLEWLLTMYPPEQYSGGSPRRKEFSLMPKLKTHSGAKKRFNLTKSGKIKRSRANKSHILTKKSTKRKRGLRQGTYADVTNESAIRRMIPYK